jgi:hypothetical protein
MGKLAARARKPVAFRTVTKIWKKLKTERLHISSTPIAKCDWRAAPSIQRYFLSLKPDLPLAISPGIFSGNAPEKFSVAGPNCHASGARYRHREDTE